MEDYRITVLYLLSLFVYQMFWGMLCVYEKRLPTLISKIGANVGFICLLIAIVFAFFVSKWWVVLVSLPIIWFCSGFLGGKIANRYHIPTVCVMVCVFALSVMYHTYLYI